VDAPGRRRGRRCLVTSTRKEPAHREPFKFTCISTRMHVGTCVHAKSFAALSDWTRHTQAMAAASIWSSDICANSLSVIGKF
jgi:hypothetical protein